MKWHTPFFIFFSWLGICLVGCSDGDSIRQYQVPRSDDLRSATSPSPQLGASRTLAAMFLVEPNAWFFKINGPDQAVSKISSTFDTFIDTVRFEANGPIWTAPDQWQRQPSSQMRFATLTFRAGSVPLELTVIPLKLPANPSDSYVLENINRWREELGLAAIDTQQLEDHLSRRDVAGREAICVELVGTSSVNKNTRPPFAGSPGRVPSSNVTTLPSSPPDFEKPAGWKSQPASGMRKAAFSIGDTADATEVTVIDLPTMGTLLDNVNRWRQQVDLSEIDSAQLNKLVKPLTVDGQVAHFVELIGPNTSENQEAILGVITERDGRSWFVKMKGKASLVEQEKENFQNFISSIKFHKATGDSHGE